MTEGVSGKLGGAAKTWGVGEGIREGGGAEKGLRQGRECCGRGTRTRTGEPRSGGAAEVEAQRWVHDVFLSKEFLGFEGTKRGACFVLP
jgi:hypothetical protein